MICPFCRQAATRSQRHCTDCGNELFPVCGRCNRASPRSVFCQQCGFPLGQIKTLKKGAYRLIKLLGEGGMGKTYLAVDTGGRRFAIKEMRGLITAQPKAHELFRREAIALHNLSHPAIPQLVDFFLEGDHRIQVMELICGSSLECLAKEAGGRLPEHRAVNWMIELCEILDYLHGVGVIHRDIKPANLIIRRRLGKLALIDFGAVKEAGTPPGTVIATPGFTAYEQSQGTALPQSDLFSVGATLVALVTGQPPARIYDMNQGVFIGIERHGMSAALARVVQQATRLSPAERYSSAHELKRALSTV